jgi:hypothetical protein
VELPEILIHFAPGIELEMTFFSIPYDGQDLGAVIVRNTWTYCVMPGDVSITTEMNIITLHSRILHVA